jgi:two-component system, cell cycle sensor histidine kinase and response regulator CckA
VIRLGRRQVLLVEDEHTLRHLVEKILTRAGMRVTAVETGADALQCVLDECPFDIILADLHLPDISGLDVARRIRRRWPDVSVLYTTAFVDDLFVDTHYLGEGEAFLEKPYSGRGLLEAVALLV